MFNFARLKCNFTFLLFQSLIFSSPWQKLLPWNIFYACIEVNFPMDWNNLRLSYLTFLNAIIERHRSLSNTGVPMKNVKWAFKFCLICIHKIYIIRETCQYFVFNFAENFIPPLIWSFLKLQRKIFTTYPKNDTFLQGNLTMSVCSYCIFSYHREQFDNVYIAHSVIIFIFHNN